MRDNAPWLVAITRNRRVENESLQDFIEKKRNMFVLQVSSNFFFKQSLLFSLFFFYSMN
jgi:hypothetical protein